jgi:phage head maturation protease
MLEMQRSFSAAPSTLDKANRTVEVTAVSGYAPGQRHAPDPSGGRSVWIEELDPHAVDLSAMVGLPALRDHRNSTESAIGVIADARREGEKIVATIRFDGSASASELMDKIASRSVASVSVGYSVERYQKIETRAGKPVFRAAQWQPLELSFVPVPFDKGATVRSQKETAMSIENAVADGNTIAVNDNVGGVTMNRAAVNAEVRSIARAAGLSGAWADQHIDNETPVDAVRAAAFDELKKRSAQTINTATIQVGVSHDDPNMMVRAMSDALACKLNSSIKPEGRAVQYMDYSMLDMVRDLAFARGENIGRSRAAVADAIFTRSVSTSDLPIALSNAANKALAPAYRLADPSFTKWCATRQVADFKPATQVRISEFPEMRELAAEGAEVEYATIGESSETIKAKSFSLGFKMTRQLLINDDLNAVGDYLRDAGASIARSQNKRAYEMLQSNSAGGPTLGDGLSVFHTTHTNKSASGSAIDIDSVSAGIKAMLDMKTDYGNFMAIQPRYLLVGTANKLAAERLVASITPTVISAVNPLSGKLEIIVDPHVVGNRWYLLADPSALPTFVSFTVSGGYSTPTAKTEIDFETEAMKFRVGIDWNCAAIDFRGAYFNSGT